MISLKSRAGLSLILGIFSLYAILCARAVGATSSGEASGAGGAYAEFPLWTDVPGQSFAKLKEGRLDNGTRWAAYASRVGRGAKAGRNPCLTVARITAFGAYTNAVGCGPLAPGAGNRPVYVSVSASYQNKPGGPLLGETEMALSFSPGITSVKLTLSNGEALGRKTNIFKRSQRRRAHLVRFRYLAVALDRDRCVETVTGFNQSGAEVFESDTEQCPR